METILARYRALQKQRVLQKRVILSRQKNRQGIISLIIKFIQLSQLKKLDRTLSMYRIFMKIAVLALKDIFSLYMPKIHTLKLDFFLRQKLQAILQLKIHAFLFLLRITKDRIELNKLIIEDKKIISLHKNDREGLKLSLDRFVIKDKQNYPKTTSNEKHGKYYNLLQQRREGMSEIRSRKHL